MSPYVLAVVSAWIVAQGAKFLITSVKSQKSIDFRQLYASGDMPSSHSATVVALMVVIGFKDGLNTNAFAIAMLFAAIVMYDAVMVRRSAGEQGEALSALIKEQKSQVKLPRSAKGHRPLEVTAGAFIGLICGLFIFLLTR